MFLQIIKIIIVCSFFAFSLSKSLPKLTGDHICHREENYTETVNSTSNFYSEGKEVSRVENVTKTRTVKFCCPGYDEEIVSDDNGSSRRICLSSVCMEKCINGNCTLETGKCNCNDGFTGDACDEQCPPNFYGAKCRKMCKCGERDCHPITGKCLKPGEKILIVSMKSEPMSMKNASKLQIDHNPYMLMNYSGEYGKQYNHYVKMGMNESGVEESVKKIVEYEVKKAEDEYGPLDGYIILDLENNFEPVHHPQFVTDHNKMEHDEMVAMVTVACIVVGMLIFLLAVIYIKRSSSHHAPSSTVDPEFGKMSMKTEKTGKFSKIQNSPLPGTPRRPSLKKNKSVTFDDDSFNNDSIDEVDKINRRRSQSMPNALDIAEPEPKNPPKSIMDLIEESAKRAPSPALVDASAVYIVKPRPAPFNTFPRKKVSKKPSLERIYDRIYDEIPSANDTACRKHEVDDIPIVIQTPHKK